MLPAYRYSWRMFPLPSRYFRFLSAGFATIALLLGTSYSATVSVRSLGELRQAVEQAKPGTRIEIAPGEYAGGIFATRLQGQAGKPIVIAGADPKRPPLLKGAIQLVDAAFVELHSLKLSGFAGNAIAIDDGSSYDTPAHHIVLRDLQVSDIGPAGNFHAVKIAGVDDFLITGCVFERYGTGAGLGIDAVGCHRGVIENCTVRHTPGKGGSVGIQVKGASREIVIRRNRLEHPGDRAINIGGSTGQPYFRPPLASWPTGEPRYEAKDITVEENTIIGSTAAICFVNVDGATVRANTIVQPERWAIRILQETKLPDFALSRKGIFKDNLVVFRSETWVESGCNVGNGVDAASFQFTHNAWFCIDKPAQSKPRLPTAETGGVYGIDPKFKDASAGDFRIEATGFPGGIGASR